MVGAVVLYQVGEDGEVEEITTFGGFDQITGSTIPVRIWTWMMAPIMEDMEVVAFPARSFIGEPMHVEPSPSPTPTPTPTPSPSPSPEPSAEPSPSPTPSPSPV